MIKKIIACLTICFIITGCISPVFSDASALPQPNWSDPGISEIINISDLTGWMLNGGTFDVSTYTDAESFMNDYFNARTQTRLVSPGEAQEDYYEVLPGFGINNQLVPGDSFARPLDTNRVIASSFRDHSGYGRRFSNEVNEALLSTGNLYNTKIPLLNEIEFANFVNYNHDALSIYNSFFTYTPDTPIPTPDAQYITYIENINGSGFWFKNFEQQYISNQPIYSHYPLSDYSWYGGNGFGQNSSNNVTIFELYDIIDINIVSNGTNYSVSFDINVIGDAFNRYMTGANVRGYGGLINNTVNRIAGNSQYSQVSTPYKMFTYTDSGSLDHIFQNLSAKFRNCNIYVDNVPWSLVDSPAVTPHITPEFPDAVGGEDLPSTTWPVHRPRAPYYTSVPGMLQAIEDAIQGDGKLDIDDLKPYLTDENGDPVPDPIFDPEPVPIPVPDPVNPDVVPGLPVLPAMPPEMPGLNGVSVLAEIINFTNQSLPTSLIVTFWGIVFGIVILGLIKILHK